MVLIDQFNAVEEPLIFLSTAFHVIGVEKKGTVPKRVSLILTIIKILVVRLSVCVCVMDVGVAVTNLRVVCKTITCASAFTEMAILLEI